jgi:hypothetical protein
MSDTQPRKRQLARVVTILDYGNEAVINRGANDGVQVGDRYLVYGLGPELKDPETGEGLGQLEIVRGRAAVVHVQQRMATLRSVETRQARRRHIGGLAALGTTLEEHSEMIPLNDPEDGDYAKPI